jgi:hypothetical protein
VGTSGNSQRVVAYHAGPRRGKPNATDEEIVAEAEKGIAQIEAFLAEQPVEALAVA